ncbi:hypothetical protein CASFOL_016926 [Castilleja foliolosa]|uniref:Uncharacterized protein n=1 Tax=Castilleja foliolosa TaxID=1961234 RepID=A0ABD3DCU0_9LAMI
MMILLITSNFFIEGHYTLSFYYSLMASTPTKNTIAKEWAIPPSPKSLEALYLNTREDYFKLKDETMEFIKRIVEVCELDDIRAKILEDGEPLVKIYDLLLQVLKGMEEASDAIPKKVPEIVILDSSSSAF